MADKAKDDQQDQIERTENLRDPEAKDAAARSALPHEEAERLRKENEKASAKKK
jgi:hypothetical protein